MRARTLPPPEWPLFLEQFSPDHRAWPANVEWSDEKQVSPQTLDRLVAIAADVDHGRTTAVNVILYPEEDPQNTIRVASPTSVRVHETDQGAAQNLELDGESGTYVVLRLRGVAQPDVLLDGLAPEELS